MTVRYLQHITTHMGNIQTAPYGYVPTLVRTSKFWTLSDSFLKIGVKIIFSDFLFKGIKAVNILTLEH